MKNFNVAVDAFLTPFTQWEKMRHPYAGWLRLGLGLLLPFVIWSHDVVLILLWIAAFFSHPWWFPAYIEAGADRPFMTRLVDEWQSWLEEASKRDEALLFYAGFALAIPLVGFLWAHDAFWSAYFFLVAAGYKGLFIYFLTHKKDAE